MSSASTALVVIGALLVVLGVGALALDLTGHGDSSGLDYKDVGILVVGVILLGIGAGLRRSPSPSPAPSGPSQG